MQEFNTAKDAVLAVAPDTQIQMVKTDNYPVRVTIEYGVDPTFTKGQAEPAKYGSWETIFDSRQQALFRKNAGQRKQSIQEIQTAATRMIAANTFANTE